MAPLLGPVEAGLQDRPSAPGVLKAGMLSEGQQVGKRFMVPHARLLGQVFEVAKWVKINFR